MSLKTHTPAILQAVLFDHDGTLVDSETTHFEIWNEVLAPFGARISLEHYKKHYAGFPTRANVAQAIQDFDLNVDAHALALEKIAATDRYQNRCAFPLMPGVRAILDWCRAQRLRAAVVTGANRISLEATFAAHQLKDYFESSVCFEDVRHSKPAADSYLQALNLLGLEAHHCIALEDTQTGVRSAVAAGIEVIAIRNAWTQTQDFSQASFICDSLDGAQEYLASRVGTGVALGRYEYLDR